MKSASRRPLCLALAALGCLSCGDGGEEPAIRHVLFLTLDTTRADQLGCYGNPEVKTPAIDQLSREGTRFADCTSAAATTLSSHVSLFTGTYALHHGVPRNGFVVDAANRTLPEILADNGFWCGAFLGSAALTSRTGFDQGFDHYDEAFDVPASPGGADQSQRRAASVTSAILEKVDELRGRDGGADARLFLFAQYFDPHAPYAPPADEVARYGAKFPVGDFGQIEAAVRQQQVRAGVEPVGQQGVIGGGVSEELMRGAPGVPTETGRTLARLYAGEVSSMDKEIGRLLLGLRMRGLLDDTLVVVTADHGETFWEHGNVWNHGLWVSQTDVHVPLIMRVPGAGTGRLVTEPVSAVDVAPTVLDLLGLFEDVGAAGFDGRSLQDALLGGALPERPIFAVATQPGPALEAAEPRRAWRGARKPRAVRRGPWKLIEAPYLGMTQLFHLGRDPRETDDLLARQPIPDDAAEMRVRLEGDMRAFEQSARPLPSSFDAEQSKLLLGLGYAPGEPK